MSKPPYRSIALGLCLGAGVACVGEIGDTTGRAPGGGEQPPGPGPVLPPPPVEPEPEVIPPFRPAPAALKRLTRGQYLASVRALLGDVRLPSDLEVDTPLYGFSTVGASSLSLGPRAVEQFEEAALDLAAQVLQDPSRRVAFVGCTPASAEDPCVREFLARFGRKAWRRPPTDEELDRWSAVVTTIATSYRDVWPGLEGAVAGMLQSPSFLYRVELGAPDPSTPGRLAFDGFELATRLAYFLTGSTPDDALLDAAARGELATPAGIEREARRLLALPDAKGALRGFFDEHLKLDRLDGLTKDAATFPQMSETMGGSMRREIQHLVDDVVFTRNVDLRTLFDTRDTFVNDDLARVYGMDAPGGDTLVPRSHPARSPRAGLLTTAGFLALNAHASATSPTLRGKFVRQSMLCQEIPPPPPGVQTTLPEPPAATGPQTLRQRLESLHYANPTCASCHLRMDPVGFGLESFDAIGAFRTTDNGLPVDATGEIDGKTFKNARELAALVRDHAALGPCLARMTYRYATGHLETDGERATLVALAKVLEDGGYRFQELAVAIVTSDGFRFAAAE